MKNLMVLVFLFSYHWSICQSEKVISSDTVDLYDVGDDDPQMSEAVNKARKNFGDFLAAYKNRNESQRSFSVSIPFAAEYGPEYVWLTTFEEKDGKLFGIVDNLPQSVTTVKLGDRVEVNEQKIFDWFYIENEKLVGGQTIRVRRDRMSAPDRKRFDRSFGAAID
jgi:uncharacterized protein YegJ (DUF2314 family)